ncbi:MAG TPA: MASE1 domain-containing protein [Gemmatimonadaceae bacterium]|nr:MASE1 domain-containing protein [Gemmatimonadaceae bacterium]
MSSRSPRVTTATIAQIAIIAAAYFVVARVGLQLDAVAGFATLVWASSGIALASLLLFGYRVWPAIAIGAFAINYVTGAPIFAAFGIAFGNTAEALTACYLLNRVGFDRHLNRVRDVIALVIAGSVLSTIIAASIGVTTLLAAGIVPRSGFGETWKAWWVGDAIGDLLVAPLILIWADWKPRLTLPRIGESVLLGAVVIAMGLIVFSPEPVPGVMNRGREYMLLPPLIWAALRFGIRGSVTATAVATVIAIVSTAYGHGPFNQGTLHDNLFALQTFVAICGTTFLLLGASIAERKEVNRQLVEARETAEAANNAKSGFLAVISHELRTPLNAMMGYVELLLLELDGPLTDGQRSVLDRIRQSQRHLLALIEDVLGFAQVEAGRIAFSLQPVAVHDAFAGIESIVSHEARKKEINIEVAEVDPSFIVRADPNKLRQILLNLITNAIKFTEAGGTIHVSAARVDNGICLQVADTGIGIAAENVPRVFDPFFQVDQGGTRKYPGVGLGLSIVRDAVLAMNGETGIESEQGKGTRVKITLPCADSTSPAEMIHVTPTQAVAGSSRDALPPAVMRP